MTRAALLALSLLLAGCPGPNPAFDAGTLPDGGPCPLELDLGTELLPRDGGYQREFSSLRDGGALEIIFGPQGGRHVWVSARASGLPRTGTLTWVLRSNGAQYGPLRLVLTRNEPGYYPITCGWDHRNNALVLPDTGAPSGGEAAELEATWSEFGSAPVVVTTPVQLR